ncbi:hypothetical protein GCM10020358_46390 [Amorphoplanes nipponensis]|uniref:DUF3800 domain-containing protein n=1 Tax=Actinoplanes nipponensis TaxID=135950 RepID=A0A919JMG6_9ACTN|nr:DUF3800 domain-containing protein [Actinoplanes nipponensis]GIE53488.1 hypothetical protein Ani05nite_70220 [Actinoplanes nipponensis]
MLIAYVDESGNTGRITQGGSAAYALGCLLIRSRDWPASFDALQAFRQRIRDKFGVPMRAEIKASHLLRGGGTIRDLGLAPAVRRLIFRAHLRELDNLKTKAFGIVIDKRARSVAPEQVFDLGWETLLQRLERASRFAGHDEDGPFMIVHDEGEDDQIRKLVRKARRHLTAGSAFGAGGLSNAARKLVDDPVSRRSEHSHFIQLADLVAYAAFRDTIPPGASVAAVCPRTMWAQIGNAIRTETNYLKGGTPGIVVRKN